MKEEDIRPVDLRKKCELLFEEDAKRLLLRRSEFVEMPCPACERDNKKTSFYKNGYTFKRCGDCRTYYISPRPRPELLKQYYTTSKASRFWQERMFPSSKEARVKNIYAPRADMILDVVRRHKIGNELLVDVGAGSGFFGEEIAARNVFKKTVLVEPGPIKIKNSDKLSIINDSFENINLDLKPDIVTNFELIEHLFSPVDFLTKIRSLMRDGSYFVFTTPNIEGFELATIFDKSVNVAGPNHLNYFNIDSIRILLERMGFKSIEVSTPGELDCDIVQTRHKEGVIDLKRAPFMHYMLIENGNKFVKPFQEFLKRNKLSSNMLISAKK